MVLYRLLSSLPSMMNYGPSFPLVHRRLNGQFPWELSVCLFFCRLLNGLLTIILILFNVQSLIVSNILLIELGPL